VADDEVRLFLAGLQARRRVEISVSEPEASGRQRRG
jgi:hypothetical protein